MWTTASDELPGTNGLRVTLAHDARPATFADVIRAWDGDEPFRAQFNALLANVPYTAFRWETPGVTEATLTQPFDFVVLDSPGLARRPDPAAFADYFPRAADGIATFANLGGDAVLVVPCPEAESSAYGHLAAFVRHAPERQRDAFWRAVGAALARRVGAKPVWLSTAGAGVAWLHARLDDRPKYYGHAPYRRPPARTE
jgi:hypothetical protein